MNRAVVLLLLLVFVGAMTPATAADKRAERRAELDEVAREALEELFEEKSQARRLYDEAYGYAVFDNLKIVFLLSGGGGAGVAVNKRTGERTYMKMGTAGLNVGLGGQKYTVIFLFENERAFTRFVDKGWYADAQASASAGTKAADAVTTFHDGVAVFQFTEAGLMAAADISGTRYWKNDKLN